MKTCPRCADAADAERLLDLMLKLTDEEIPVPGMQQRIKP